MGLRAVHEISRTWNTGALLLLYLLRRMATRDETRKGIDHPYSSFIYEIYSKTEPQVVYEVPDYGAPSSL